MRHARPALISPCLFGLMLICSSCYGPYRSPYGGYGNPYGAPGAPVQTLQPGGTYTPTPYGQPLPSGIPQGSLGQPSTIDQTGGDAPFYNSGSSSRPPYDGGGVPTYSDPNEIQFHNNGGFQQPIESDNTATDSWGFNDGVIPASAGVAKVNLDATGFVSPVLTTPSPTLPALPAGTSGLFAHDAEYRWLRGVLRYDPDDEVWIMIYSDNPSAGDEHGGQLIVAESPALEQFKPQSVVLLRGEIDAEQSATLGRATYRADVVEPVELSGP